MFLDWECDRNCLRSHQRSNTKLQIPPKQLLPFMISPFIRLSFALKIWRREAQGKMWSVQQLRTHFYIWEYGQCSSSATIATLSGVGDRGFSSMGGLYQRFMAFFLNPESLILYRLPIHIISVADTIQLSYFTKYTSLITNFKWY